MIETANVMRHEVPAGMLGRVIFTAIGGGLMVVGVQQAIVFHYPVDASNWLMAVTVAGTLVFGAAFLNVALFRPEQRWRIGRGMVEIDSANPFRSWSEQFGRRDVTGFSVRRDDSGDTTSWTVLLKTERGKRFETQDLGSEAAAERLMRQMQDAFYG